MLNYTIPDFQFLIGSFDASEYLDSINLSVPMHELGQDLLWTGDFKISYNLKAKSRGLTESDFSEVAYPHLWRPYQKPVKLLIKGYPSPIFRIENYRYNRQTKEGVGKLVQLPVAFAGDRPGVTLPYHFYVTTNSTSDTPVKRLLKGTIGSAIDKLLSEAFIPVLSRTGVIDRRVFDPVNLNQVESQPQTYRSNTDPSFQLPQLKYATAGDDGGLDLPLVTRDPIADAVRLSTMSWNWLTVNSQETIVSVNGAANETIFSRPDKDVELLPDLNAIFQTAYKVVVTGATLILDDGLGGKGTESKERPKFKTTQEFRPIGTVFTNLGSDITPLLVEEKTIIYQYWDDDRWSDFLPLFGDHFIQFAYDINSNSGIDRYAQPPSDLSIPLQTITIKRQPYSYMFPGTGTETRLHEAEVIIESKLRKLTLKPYGLVFNGVDLTLVVEKREDLTSAIVPDGVQLNAPRVNRDGESQQYESRPLLEAPNPVAEVPTKTQVLRGEARLQPYNWTPIYPYKPLIIDLGSLPSNSRATFLARKIAIREQRRRDQVLVTMPIPSEWLTSGWALLKSCQIGSDVYLMDGCALTIGKQEAKFAFTGALISRGVTIPIDGIPVLVQQEQHFFIQDIGTPVLFEYEIKSLEQTAADISRSVFKPTIDFEVELTSQSISSIPTDLSARIVFEGIISTSTSTSPQTLTFSVSPTSELRNVQQPVQTLTFAVSPTSELRNVPQPVQTLTFSVSPTSELRSI